MGDVGHEVPAGRLRALDFRDVVQHGDRAPTGHGSGVDLKDFSRGNGDGAPPAGLALGEGRAHRGQDLGIANGMHQGAALLHRAERDPLHDGIAPAHLSLRVDGDDRLLHAVQQRGQFAAAAFQGMKAVLQAAGGDVERMGDGGNLIQIALFHPGRQIAGGDAIGEDHDAGQALGGPLRQQCRQQGRHHQREQRSQHNTAAQHVHRLQECPVRG